MFAVITSYLVIGERFNLRAMLGAACVLTGILIADLLGPPAAPGTGDANSQHDAGRGQGGCRRQRPCGRVTVEAAYGLRRVGLHDDQVGREDAAAGRGGRCRDEAKRRLGELRDDDRVLCWIRGYSDGGAIPLVHVRRLDVPADNDVVLATANGPALVRQR